MPPLPGPIVDALLTAATVSAKLHKFLEELDLPIHRTIFWTDSTIVLQCLRNETKRFQTFVVNRLAIIRDVSLPCQWRHVNSRSNPADLASRGLSNIDPVKLRFWLGGPDFLKEEESKLPRQTEQSCLDKRSNYPTCVKTTASLDETGLRSILWYKKTFYRPSCQDITLSTSFRRQWLGCYDSKIICVCKLTGFPLRNALKEI